MVTKKIAREVSRKTGITTAEATHDVERLVHNILRKLHKGQTATLPGLGDLVVGVGGRISFRKESE